MKPGRTQAAGFSGGFNGEHTMVDNKRIEGGIDRVSGTIKEHVGHATGDRQMEGEGRAENTVGKVEQTVGKVKDKIRDTLR
jgi:uncharacterized protein YjbJ (UPF0337 family)